MPPTDKRSTMSADVSKPQHITHTHTHARTHTHTYTGILITYAVRLYVIAVFKKVDTGGRGFSERRGAALMDFPERVYRYPLELH